MEEIIDGYAEWQNRPDLTGIGRMPERAAFFRYADKREALSEAGLQSALYAAQREMALSPLPQSPETAGGVCRSKFSRSRL